MITMTEPRPAVMTTAPTLDEAIAFIWAEADMLDRLDYKAWLSLWTDEGRYIIPTERSVDDYDDRLNVVNDDAEMRAARVKRLLSGFSMSSAPPARTVRTVSRFVPEAGDDGGLTHRSWPSINMSECAFWRPISTIASSAVRRASRSTARSSHW